MKKFLVLFLFYVSNASQLSPTFMPFVGLAESLKALIQERKKIRQIPAPQIRLDVTNF